MVKIGIILPREVGGGSGRGLGQVVVARLVEEEEQRWLIPTDQEGRTPMPMGDGRGFSPAAPCPAGGGAQRVPCSAGG